MSSVVSYVGADCGEEITVLLFSLGQLCLFLLRPVTHNTRLLFQNHKIHNNDYNGDNNNNNNNEHISKALLHVKHAQLH